MTGGGAVAGDSEACSQGLLSIKKDLHFCLGNSTHEMLVFVMRAVLHVMTEMLWQQVPQLLELGSGQIDHPTSELSARLQMFLSRTG